MKKFSEIRLEKETHFIKWLTELQEVHKLLCPVNSMEQFLVQCIQFFLQLRHPRLKAETIDAQIVVDNQRKEGFYGCQQAEIVRPIPVRPGEVWPGKEISQSNPVLIFNVMYFSAKLKKEN